MSLDCYVSLLLCCRPMSEIEIRCSEMNGYSAGDGRPVEWGITVVI